MGPTTSKILVKTLQLIFFSSNCINIYSSYTDPLQSGSVAPVDGAPLDGSGHVNVRRSASGVFR